MARLRLGDFRLGRNLADFNVRLAAVGFRLGLGLGLAFLDLGQEFGQQLGQPVEPRLKPDDPLKHLRVAAGGFGRGDGGNGSGFGRYSGRCGCLGRCFFNARRSFSGSLGRVFSFDCRFGGFDCRRNGGSLAY